MLLVELLKFYPQKKKILIIGIAYKKDVADYREAPALKVLEHLLNLGYKVSYHDDYICNLEVITKKKKLKLKSKKINKQNIIKYDLSIILTNHSYIDWEIVKKFSKKIFDTRNVFKEDNNKIILL